MRKQIEMLKHHSHLLADMVDIYPLLRDVNTIKNNLSAGGLLQEI